jgi:biotin carboxyl carrier protein
MVPRQSSSEAADPSGASAAPQQQRVRHRMSTRNRLLFFITAWLIVLMPFLFWWNTWFGRQLSASQMDEYLNDDKHPRHIQHALVQLGERMARHDGSVARWQPQLIRLAAHPVEEVRNTDAWVMGQDTSAAGFHESLLKMLQDSSLTVRGNAALSLVRFGDPAGRPQIVALLQPATITAPSAGKITDTDKPGTSIHQGGLVAKVQTGDSTVEVRSPIAGRIRTLTASTGANVTTGTEIATIDPAAEQVWEALRALYLVGQPDDLPAVRAYERDLPDISDRLRQQATLTEQAIRDRASK